MAAQRRQRAPSLSVRGDQPLIGISLEEPDEEVVRYFTTEEDADQSISDQEIEVAIDLAGAWSHLDWDDMVEALDRIRHESKPTPPIEL